jgi:hypothetical protein
MVVGRQTQGEQKMIVCIFCGSQDPVHYKQLSNKFVLHIVQRQQAAGICEPIVNFISSHLANETDKWTTERAANEKESKDGEALDGEALDGEAHYGVAHDGEAHDGEAHDGEAHDGEAHDGEAHDGEGQDGEAHDADFDSVEEDDCEEHVHSCMCCFYWVARRQKQQLVPLPMQNLLWYVRTLKGCESNKCDSRILLRLVKTVTERWNMYARFFAASEMEGMAAIKDLSQASTATAPPVQGQRSFCVKKQLAELWHSNNAQSMLVAHAHAADLLR